MLTTATAYVVYAAIFATLMNCLSVRTQVSSTVVDDTNTDHRSEGQEGEVVSVARVTVIASDAQVEYRVQHLHGCSPDVAVDYRLDGVEGGVLVLGALAREFGFQAGQTLSTDADRDAIRAVLSGVNPGTGERFADPVERTHPDAQLPAQPLIDAVRAVAEQREPSMAGGPNAARTAGRDGVAWSSAAAAKSWDRMVRGAARDGLSHRAAIGRLSTLAGQYGIDLAGVYGSERVAAAQLAADERVDVRVRGFDLTLDLEKSVSIALALSPDRGRLEDRLRAYTAQFVSDLEVQYARGVVGHHGDGQERREVAGSGLFVTATFDPVSREGDAHWHVHLMIANAIKDAEGTWRALSRGADDLHHNAAAIGEAYKSGARELLMREQNWQFEQRVANRKGTLVWRVSGVDEDQVRATSSRQRGVESYARDQWGLAWDQCSETQQQAARDRTRPGKNTARHQAGIADLVGFTRATLADAAARVDPTVQSHVSQRPGSWEHDVRVAAAAIAAECTATSSTFRFSDAKVAALGALPGVAREFQDQLVAAALDDPRVVSMERYAESRQHPSPSWRGVWSTVDVIDGERRLDRLLVDDRADRGTERGNSRGRGAVLTERQLRAGLAEFEAGADFQLSAQQRAVITTVATADSSVVAIEGAAGTGKTTIMRALAVAYGRAGMTVSGTSAAAVAKEVLAAKAGIDAETIAGLVGVRGGWQPDRDKAWAAVGDVLIVDEAGMADIRDLAELADECGHRGKRMVLVGDRLQLPAVGAAGGFAAVVEHAQEVGGFAELTEVRRQQQAHELQALRAWRAGRYADAVSSYVEHGQVHVVDTHSAALELTAELYRARSAQAGDPLERAGTAGLIVARADDAATVGNLARLAAREAGELSGPDHRFRTPGGWIDLAVGELVLLKKNQRLVDNAGDRVDLLNGRRAIVEDISVAGDLTLRWEDPDGELARGTVTAEDLAADGSIVPGYVERGAVLHGAGATTHSSQGSTVENAVVLGTGIASPELAYVALSRDEQRVDVVLAIEDLARTPEEAAWLTALPDQEKVREAAARWAVEISAGAGENRSLHEQLVAAEQQDERRSATRQHDAAPVAGESTASLGQADDAAARHAQLIEQLAETLQAVGPELAPEDLVERVVQPDDGATLALASVLQGLRTNGADPAEAMREALNNGLDEPAPARNAAAVLAWRVQHATLDEPTTGLGDAPATASTDLDPDTDPAVREANDALNPWLDAGLDAGLNGGLDRSPGVWNEHSPQIDNGPSMQQ